MPPIPAPMTPNSHDTVVQNVPQDILGRWFKYTLVDGSAAAVIESTRPSVERAAHCARWADRLVNTAAALFGLSISCALALALLDIADADEAFFATLHLPQPHPLLPFVLLPIAVLCWVAVRVAAAWKWSALDGARKVLEAAAVTYVNAPEAYTPQVREEVLANRDIAREVCEAIDTKVGKEQARAHQERIDRTTARALSE